MIEKEFVVERVAHALRDAYPLTCGSLHVARELADEVVESLSVSDLRVLLFDAERRVA